MPEHVGARRTHRGGRKHRERRLATEAAKAARAAMSSVPPAERVIAHAPSPSTVSCASAAGSAEAASSEDAREAVSVDECRAGNAACTPQCRCATCRIYIDSNGGAYCVNVNCVAVMPRDSPFDTCKPCAFPNRIARPASHDWNADEHCRQCKSVRAPGSDLCAFHVHTTAKPAPAACEFCGGTALVDGVCFGACAAPSPMHVQPPVKPCRSCNIMCIGILSPFDVCSACVEQATRMRVCGHLPHCDAQIPVFALACAHCVAIVNGEVQPM